MRVLGIDFTSRPTGRKPITCLSCTLLKDRLQAERLDELHSFTDFERVLASPGPWIAGIDFPFGQARKFIETVGWPNTWPGYVAHVQSLSRQEFRLLLDNYRVGRCEGDKEHRRKSDVLAGSISPQKLYGVPVALMFFEGAARLLKAGVSIPKLQTGDNDRIVVEAYPGVIARRFIGRRSYKSDNKKKQTAAQRSARIALFDQMLAETASAYGFHVKAPRSLADDPSGDQIDALLCAVQAGWAWTQRSTGFGASVECDDLEGWIADPLCQQSRKVN
jgi:Protein of unknown function (DUF429)